MRTETDIDLTWLIISTDWLFSSLMKMLSLKDKLMF